MVPITHEAGCEEYGLVETVSEKFVLTVSQAVEHLNRTLTVTNVVDLFDVGDFLHLSDVGSVVVQAHLCPGEVPILAVIFCIQRLVSL